MKGEKQQKSDNARNKIWIERKWNYKRDNCGSVDIVAIELPLEV